MGAGLGFKHAVQLQCEKDVGMGHCLLLLCYHPYLVCILLGMPSLHLFKFLMFFISCFLYFFFDVNLSYSLIDLSLKKISFTECNHNPRT